MNGVKTNVYHITYFPKSKTACLYFWGCNFHCLGCIRRRCNFDVHLPFSLLRPADKKIENFLTVNQILNVLGKEKINKVIFLGGEPTLDSKLVFLTRKLKEKFNSFNVLLTNGYILPELSFFDEVCLGIKAKTSSLHREYTGKNPQPVFKNLRNLDESNIILRTESIFIPDYIGLEETGRIARALSKINPSIPHRIDAYIPVLGLNQRRPNFTEIKEAVKAAKKYLKEVSYIRVNKKKSSLVRILI